MEQAKTHDLTHLAKQVTVWTETMAETADAINSLSDQVHADIKQNGFWEEPRSFGELIALTHSELSEALEADREDIMDKHLPHRPGIEVELADAIIRIMDIAGAYQLDLGGAVIEKIAFNRTRDFKHGKKY